MLAIFRKKDVGVLNFSDERSSRFALSRLGATISSSANARRLLNGLWEPCSANSLRYSAYDGTGNTGLLVESEQTNLCLYSSEANAAWVNTGGTPTDTTCVSIISGKTAPRHASSGANIGKAQTVGTYSGGMEYVYVDVETDTAPSVDLQFYNSTTPATVSRIRLTFATGEVSQVNGTCDGSGAINMGAGKNGGTVWRLYQIKDTTDVSGDSRTIIFYPDSSGGGGRSIRHHVQLVESDTLTSPIVTTSASVTRAADNISFTKPSYIGNSAYSFSGRFASSGRNDYLAMAAILGGSDGTADNYVVFGSGMGIPAAVIHKDAETGIVTATGAETSTGGSIAASFNSTSVNIVHIDDDNTAAGITMPTITTLYIGSLLGSSHLNGVINRISIYPQYLTIPALYGTI